MGILPYAICRDDPEKRLRPHWKCTNDTLEMSALDQSTASMSHIRHYRVLPWATGPLTLLESIAKVPDWQVTKMDKWSIFRLSDYLPTRRQQNNCYSYYNDSNVKEQHKSLGIALTTYCYRRTQTILQWFSSTPMLMLSAIRHFTRISLFIAGMPPGSSTEHVFTVKDELRMATAKVRYIV